MAGILLPPPLLLLLYHHPQQDSKPILFNSIWIELTKCLPCAVRYGSVLCICAVGWAWSILVVWVHWTYYYQPLGMNRCQEPLHSGTGANLHLKWWFPSVHPASGNMGESKGEYIFIPMGLPSLRAGLQEGGGSQPQSQAAPAEQLTLPAWCLSRSDIIWN